MGSGDQSGTWGTTTNTNLGTLLEAAIAGRAAVSMTDADYTLTVANGSADEARNMILNISGALTATRNVICPAVSKMYIVKNATTGGQSIILKTSAGTGVTISNGVTTIVFCDGTNVVDGINSLNSINGITITGTAARIQGDFSNATFVNRTAFQDKTANSPTGVSALPNGTNQVSFFSATNNSDPTNAAYLGIGINATTATLTSSTTGSGTALPLTVLVGASGLEAARFDTSGNFLHGATTTNGLVGNLKQTVGGIFSTVNGSVSAASTTATTIFTIPNVNASMWIVSVQLQAGDTGNYSALAIIATQNGSIRFISNVAGALLIISNSGLNIRAEQYSGTTASIFYSAIRIM
jgi:hypothetical protein